MSTKTPSKDKSAPRAVLTPKKLGPDAKFRRILLKLSGEALMGDHSYGIDPKVVERLADEIREVVESGVEIALVVGGGNIFRGMSGSAAGMDRASADYMGMLATVMNSLALQDQLEKKGVYTRVMAALRMEAVAEPYIRRRAIRHLEKSRVVIFAAGTGNPYFTTDTAASLRAMEIEADAVFKATKVDGVYDKDPMKHKDAVRYDSLTYLDVLQKGLQVMDATAISLCMDHSLPIVVFSMNKPGNIKRVICGEPLGTIVCSPEALKSKKKSPPRYDLNKKLLSLDPEEIWQLQRQKVSTLMVFWPNLRLKTQRASKH